MALSCPFDSDDQFGPRISTQCRSFDFTLLFEDVFFALLPAAIFLLLAALRLPVILKAPVKIGSHRLATTKLTALTCLLAFHVTFLAFQIQAPILQTKVALAGNLLQLIAVGASLLLSWLEDQRSIRPSDLMVIYFFLSSILSAPRLRSLWLLAPVVQTQAALWTMVTVGTILVMCLESIHKTQAIRLAFREPSKESTSSFWARSFFIWVIPLFRSGSSAIISLKEMPEVDSALQGIPAEQKLHNAWKSGSYTSTGKNRLLRATFRAYRGPFASAIIPQICFTGFKFCQPFLISATIDFISEPSTQENRIHGHALVGAYILTYMGMTISKAAYWRQTIRLITMVRAGLISLVYRQTTKLQTRDFKDKSSITLISTDVERIIYRLHGIHEAWMAPIQVAIAIFLLERQLGVACLIPTVISTLAILGTIPLSKFSSGAQLKWIERVQARLAVVSSMLHDMKAVKMLGISDKLFHSISTLRRKELEASERFRILLIWQIALSFLPVNLAPFATFAIFSIIAVTSSGESLFSSRTFTSLSLISLMTSPLLIFVQSLPGLWQSVGCFDRIEKYCAQVPFGEELDHDHANAPDEIELQTKTGSLLSSADSVIDLHDASFSWSDNAEPSLHDLNISFKKAMITAVVGPVGSGKSTLLESLFGETILQSGSMSAFHSTVAYCPQTPWIMNDTIRQNITGPGSFDEKWYDFVLWACSLEADLQNIPGGDLSIAGTSGITLSGGQKQRISLARAVYSRAAILVLDDIFSGLDTRSVAAISSRLLAADGHFKKAGRTVILATHNNRLLPLTDRILMLDNGHLAKTGTYEQLRSAIPEDSQTPQNQEIDDQNDATIDKTTDSIRVSKFSEASSDDDTTVDSSRREGSWSVYTFYFQSAGWTMVATVAISVGLYGFADKFSTVWLQQWSNANDHHPNQRIGLYIGIYALLFTMSLMTLIIGTWALFIKSINNTGLALHSHLLGTTLRAPYSFFQKVDAGMTTNRFSQDLELIDLDLPNEAIVSTLALANCATGLVILCIMGKYLTVTVPVLVVILFFVQRYYLQTSRQVRLLDIEAKAPLLTHLAETMQGMPVIRAMRWQNSFQNRLDKLLNQSQQPFYMLFCIQQWLQLVLDCIVMALAVILVSLVVSLKDKFSPGAIGVALNLILSFNLDLMQLIQSWTRLETSIGAVSRIQDFVQNTPSEDNGHRRLESASANWLNSGKISFQGITAIYNSRSPPALHNLSLSIEPGEKIAVCGPSGSGKTSLILGLLQMIELQQGKIEIDDQDLSALPCGTVRSRVNVIPQDPFFMPGTLRFNLDRGLEDSPVSDMCLIRALETVGLWKKVCHDTPRGEELDQQLSVSDWSVGERQLLALARALVMKSPILILDEATSSVDWETEATMQGIIERDFASQTVISVVHRLRYIERFDRVALMKNGRLVEFDSPSALLARPSEFQTFYYAKQAE